ncbi:MAG TPA: nucleoside-diphosphate sugar epimerase [Leptospiraceae bacterium]|nr:nucleoside-diphosphate sugar epimerase [Spirochaetaceae bacterium]HBS05732.1 nucleoside-diphosphate sugar epimerase [Leptospiraceae bacterium]|tara:strand:- start:2586 stop:3410 length:825 start_codon:yes stop_codon:yes gene_type:complete
MKVYVFGATGTVGQPLVEELTKQGHEVLAVSRKPGPEKKGVQYVDPEPANMKGADAVFLLSPGGLADQYSVLKPYLDEAKKIKPGKIVAMTAFGVEFAPEEVPLRKLELEVLNSGLNATILRPNWFMQNFNSYWIQGILADGKIYFPGGDAKAGFIDARDIAACAASVLTGTDYSGEGLGLTGPQPLDHNEVAAKLSAATGKEIQYVDVDPEDFKVSLKEAGLPQDYIEVLSGIAAGLKAGQASAVTDSVQKILGRAPITFDQYARDYASAYQS